MDAQRQALINQMAKTLQQMEGELRCCICQDMYRFPVTLSCGHSFCKECAQNYFRQGSKAANRNEEAGRSTCCPQCGKKASKRSMTENKTILEQVSVFREIVHELEELLDVENFTAVRIVRSDREAPGDTPCPKTTLALTEKSREKKTTRASSRIITKSTCEPTPSTSGDVPSENVSSNNSRNQLRADKAEKDGKEAKQELASKTRDPEKLDREEATGSPEVKAAGPSRGVKRKRTLIEESSKNSRDQAKADKNNLELALAPKTTDMVEKLERDYKALQQSYDDVSTRLNASDSELKALKTEQTNLLKKLDDSRRNSTIVQELRDSYEKQLLERQKEFSDLYDGKLKKLQDKLDEAKRSSSALTLRIVDLEASNTSLQASNTSLQKGMSELQKELASRDAELKNKDEQMEAMNKDYKDLKETKVAIEMEITAYRRLMDGDEARSDPQDPTGSPEPDAAGPSRGIQRRRTLIEEDGQNTERESHIIPGSDDVFEEEDEEPTEEDGNKENEDTTEQHDGYSSGEDILLGTPVELQPLNASRGRRRLSRLLSPMQPSNVKNDEIFIACSGLMAQEKDEVNKFVIRFGLKGAKDMKVDATHLIVKIQDKYPAMTLKMFQAVARKLWVVGMSWVQESMLQGFLVDPQPFEVVCRQGDPGPRRARLSNNTQLLEGIEFYFDGVFNAMKKEDLIYLVTTCGAQTSRSTHSFSLRKKCIVVVENKDSLALMAQADRTYRLLKIPTVTADWVRDSIVAFQVKPIKDYMIHQVTPIEMENLVRTYER